MFRKYRCSLLLASLLSLSCTNNKAMAPDIEYRSGVKNATGFAVVELFTSEGCSSCPAADRAVEELAKKYPDDVYILAFHVDYWNRLGWVDSFSNAAYTQRQSNYASQFGLSSIYTPQVVVNGREEFVGSDKAKLLSVTDAELKRVAGDSIEILAETKDAKRISVRFKAETSDDRQLNIVLVQNEATTDVKRGENGGRQLRHINIVRDYKVLLSKKGTVEFTLPPSLPVNQIKIIAYQQNASGIITAVNKVNVTEF